MKEGNEMEIAEILREYEKGCSNGEKPSDCPECLEAAIAAIERAARAKWQPIETAPRDGTEVLCCFDWIKGGERTVAKYKETSHGVGYFAPPRSYVQHNFTHWTPLPEPPK